MLTLTLVHTAISLVGIFTGLTYAGFILALRQGNNDLRRPAGPLFEATLAAIVPGFNYFSVWFLLPVFVFLFIATETRGRILTGQVTISASWLGEPI